jgi:glyoxylase-like metal-dependent hydrolase (beta-lactamase superfamily II)
MDYPLEDSFNDILEKAQIGLGLSDLEIAQQAKTTVEEYSKLKNGIYNPTLLQRLSPILDLRWEPLNDIAQEKWTPEVPPHIAGVQRFFSSYLNYAVNSYIIWDPTTKQSAIIDTGTDGNKILDFVEENELQVNYIFLTHAHSDHVAEFDRLKQATHATVYIHQNENFRDALLFVEGDRFKIGGLNLSIFHTPGHSRGSSSFYVEGLERPLCFVGDALFSGSIGRPQGAYSSSRENLKQKILSLPADTILYPGHGPATTVAEEIQHNPFF